MGEHSRAVEDIQQSERLGNHSFKTYVQERFKLKCSGLTESN